MDKWYYWYCAILCLLMLICGLIFAAIRHELIIIRTSAQKISDEVRQVQAERKKITCYFVKDLKVKTEDVDILCMSDALMTTQHICNAWLQVVYDEQVLSKPVSVTHVAAGDEQKIYISFDRNPFDKHAPIINKVHFIQSLLKTLEQSGITYARVMFMVNGAVLQDQHLDFTHSWPVKDVKLV